jgi:DNA-directed RNA polymerase subunit RPC12/RpoP
MQYKFSKCPYCGHFVEVKTTGWNDIEEQIGLPLAICSSCKRAYDTGKRLWKDMDIADRVIIFARMAFGAVFGGFFAGTALMLLLVFLNSYFKWFESNNAYRSAMYWCFLIGILFSTWGHIAHFRELKQLE